MAIDLPQSLPPQLTSLAKIESYAAGATPYVGIVNGYELRVTGDHHLTHEEIAKIFSAANTPSQAIILMNSLAVRKGYLLVNMQYAADVTVVHVHALQGRITELRGEGVAEYFDGLKGDPELTRADFDRARVMANVKSERTGVNYSAHYELSNDDPREIALVFEAAPVEDHDATDLTLQLGNQGSRYVGRYFGDIALSHNFDNGARAAAAYQTAFTEWGESREGEDYHRIQVALDRPFQFGLYGVSASHTQYSQDLGSFSTGGGTVSSLLGDLPILGDLTLTLDSLLDSLLGGVAGGASTQQVELEADINTLGFSGEQVVSSDLHYRFNVFQRLEYIDSQLDLGSFGALQDEEYGTLEIGAKYFAATAVQSRLLRWSAQISLKGGITGDSGTLGTYSEYRAATLAVNPSAEVPEVTPSARTAEFVTVKPKLTVKLPISADGSVNGNFIGQYANEQLPQQQQWVLGGSGTISAYLPGVLVGDSGYYLAANYEHEFPFSAATLTGSVFAEYGTAWYENVSGDLGGERSLLDAGVRMRAELPWKVSLDAVVARKIADDGFQDEDQLDELEADFYITLKKVF